MSQGDIYAGKPSSWPDGLYVFNERKAWYPFVLIVKDHKAAWLHKHADKLNNNWGTEEFSYSEKFVRVGDL